MADAVTMPRPWPTSSKTKGERGLTADDARILAEMFGAGAEAIAGYSAPDAGACGYAALSVGASKRFAAHLRNAGFRRVGRGRYERIILCPGYQALDAHEHVAEAMARSLNANGIDAYARGWMD